MYRTCIFCSAGLGANEAIEAFPVGRSVAFDAGKGRLWAVCPKCARWNLAPIEERWEAVEDAERIFRDTRLRVQRENVGLAKLADGTRLLRIGRALPAEQAVWRYGRARIGWWRAVGRTVAETATAAMESASSLPVAGMFVQEALRASRAHRNAQVMHRIGTERWHGGMLIRRWHLATATLVPDGAGGVQLQFPFGLAAHPEGGSVGRLRRAAVPTAIGGEEGRVLLAKAVTLVNRASTHPDQVLESVRLLEGFRSPDVFVAWVAGERLPLSRGGFVRLDRLDDTAVLNRRGGLALEMAVHQEQERRALEGELAMLAEMWRHAEEIAAIVDALPDVPPPAPPHLFAG